MIRETIGFLMISLVAVIALIIWLTVRNRRTKQEAMIQEPLPAVNSGQLKTFYVATVFEADPLERVWAHGFAMRGKALLGIDQEGISVNRTGERSFLIPASAIHGLGKASATLDKGVERDGLTVVHWSLGDVKVVTNFRFISPETRKEFEAKMSQLIGAQIG